MNRLTDGLRGIVALGVYYFICFLIACLHSYLAGDVGIDLIGLTLTWAVLLFLVIGGFLVIAGLGRCLK